MKLEALLAGNWKLEAQEAGNWKLEAKEAGNWKLEGQEAGSWKLEALENGAGKVHYWATVAIVSMVSLSLVPRLSLFAQKFSTRDL